MGIANRSEKVSRNGYWYKYMPEHKNSNKQGYVPIHHLVMEESIGRFLEEGEVVHHKDHNKLNNDLSNLQLMTDGEHKAHHAKYVQLADGTIAERARYKGKYAKIELR
jgi:hypothetical protein